MKLFRKHLLSILLLCISFQLMSQRFKTIDINNGLSNNTVRCIAQDENGFMWFGTYDGLCRYDGISFTVFRNDKNDHYSINHNFITSILAVKGGLFIGTEMGLDFLSFDDYKFNRSEILGSKGEQKIIQGSIQNIVSVGSSVFVLSNKEGLLFLNKKNIFEKFIISGEKPNTNKMIASYKEDYLIVSSNLGLQIIDIQSHKVKKQIHYNSNEPTSQIYYSSIKDLIFISSGIGYSVKVFKENEEVIEMIANEKFENIQSITDYKGNIIYGSDGNGLIMLSKGQKEIFSPKNSNISSDAIYSLFVDDANNLWIGTLRGGVNIYNESNNWFRSLSVKNKQLSHDFVTSIYETPSSTLYIGTDGGGLNVFNKKNKKLTTFTKENSDIAGDNVISIIGDGKYLWLGIYEGGLNRFDTKTGTFKKYKLPNPADNQNNEKVWVVKDDQKGNLWIGSELGLFCFNKKSEKFIVIQNLINHVSEIAFSKSSIWVSSIANGLYNIDFSGHILKHYSLNGENDRFISSNTVRYVFVDSNDFIWFGTEYIGLNKLNKTNGSISTYGKKEGFDNPNVVGITEDKNGNLWIGSNNGLYRFNPDKEIFLRFGIKDNLPSSHFTYNACYFNNDVMYFGTSKGLIWFLPDKVKYNSNIKNIEFTGFELLDKNGSEASEYRNCPSIIKLKYNENFFKISFSIPEYTCSDNINFSSNLDNFDNNWRNTGDKREVTYTNVPPGEYSFRVRSANCNGEWSESFSSIKIIITPPWWKTNLATLIFIIIAMFILYLIISLFRNALIAKHQAELQEIEKNTAKNINEAKLRFFTNISHDLRTPLFLITAPLENLTSSKDKLIQVPRKHISSMYSNALRLNKLINRIIDFRKLEAGKLKLEIQKKNIVTFCKGLMPTFEILCEQKNIILHYLPSKTEIRLAFDAEMMESILSNLIRNAVKYTHEGGKIVLSIKEDSDAVVFTIEDNGIGIKKEHLKSIFNRFFQIDQPNSSETGDGIGLSFVKEVVELHDGEISVKSKLGRGSVFKFSIPNNLISKKKENLFDKSAVFSEKLIKDTDSKMVDNLPNPTVTNCILIIDDEKEIVETIELFLHEGYKVLTAYNGIEGLAIAKKSFPDLIICDVMMPKMNGIELVTALKKDKLCAHIPVIMLTAKGDEKDMLRAFDCGADEYLTKPVSIIFLKERITQLLGKTESLNTGHFLSQKKTNYSKEEKYFLIKCKKIIDDNLNNTEFTISVIAEEMGMSHSALYKKLKSITGQSIKSFVNDYRIYNAVHLFNGGETNITTVRSKCGFNDAKNFRVNFKRKMGVSPKEYIHNL